MDGQDLVLAFVFLPSSEKFAGVRVGVLFFYLFFP